MIQRIINIWFALLAIAGGASAQSLSVHPIEVQTGEQTEVVVSLTGGTAMTALQFNLTLPEGISYAQSSNNYGATLGAAVDDHTLSVQTLDSGDLLFILYSMNLKAFKDGELLRIPVTAGNMAVNATGQLYTVHTASISGENAQSHTRDNAQFNVVVTEPDPDVVIGIEDMDEKCTQKTEQFYDLCGRRVLMATKQGIYMIDGKKVIIK